MNLISNTLKLCLVTRIQQPMDEYVTMIREAIRGGVTMVQLREKHGDMALIQHRARVLKEALHPLGVPLIINDFTHIAAEVDADGVHLGDDDMPPHAARKILGQNKIIGLSINRIDQIHACNTWNVDYLGVTVFNSTNKTDAHILGIEGLRYVAQNTQHPIIGIVGITPKNAADVIRAGAKGLAVIGAIHNTTSPYLSASQLRKRAQVCRSFL